MLASYSILAICFKSDGLQLLMLFKNSLNLMKELNPNLILLIPVAPIPDRAFLKQAVL